MSISVVNGYFCENSCDVAKAKKGEDPHPKTGSDVDSSNSPDGVRGSSRADGPAVVLGGALARVAGSEGVQRAASAEFTPSAASATSDATSSSLSSAPGSRLNILA